MSDKKSYGQLTVGFGTRLERKLDIVDFVQANYKDNRLVHVSMTEEDAIVVTVENPPSTGRAPQSSIYLSKESLLAALSTVFIYFSCKGEDLPSLLKEITTNEMIDYGYSDNLSPIKQD